MWKVERLRNVNSRGLIKEPCSDRWGKPPLDNPRREKLLAWRRWLWLLIPLIGIILFVEDSQELTEDYGHRPWWSG